MVYSQFDHNRIDPFVKMWFLDLVGYYLRTAFIYLPILECWKDALAPAPAYEIHLYPRTQKSHIMQSK